MILGGHYVFSIYVRTGDFLFLGHAENILFSEYALGGSISVSTRDLIFLIFGACEIELHYYFGTPVEVL